LPPQDDFIAFALQSLRRPAAGGQHYGDRDYDFYAQSIAHAWCRQHENLPPEALAETVPAKIRSWALQ
jgi:hypothetical protein